MQYLLGMHCLLGLGTNDSLLSAQQARLPFDLQAGAGLSIRLGFIHENGSHRGRTGRRAERVAQGWGLGGRRGDVCLVHPVVISIYCPNVAVLTANNTSR